MSDFFYNQLDYTSRDYRSIREDLIRQIPALVPEWTTRDPSDFGMVLIELFSYMADSLNFHIDRAVNETFLDTASIRDNVVALSRLLDYKPTEISPAVVTLSFSNNSLSSATVPAGTQVATTVATTSDVSQIIFETDTAITVAAGATATVTATEGKTIYGESLGSSDGGVGQVFQLYNLPVIEASAKIYVSGEPWQYVEQLNEYGPNDRVFSTETTSEQVTFVVFGDGVYGKIPSLNTLITADYRIGAGSDGNVKAGTLTQILTPAVSASGFSVTNAANAIGGADRESVSSIKFNAPLSYYSLNRAITASDYAALALRVPGVGKASAEASVYSNVSLYVAPTTYSATTPAALKQAVTTYLADKSPLGSTVTVLDPTYVDFNLSVTVATLPQYRRSAVAKAVEDELLVLFDYANVLFEDTLSQLYLMATIDGVPGVMNVTINEFYKTGGSGVSSNLVFAKNEIPRLATLTVTADTNYGLPDA